MINVQALRDSVNFQGFIDRVKEMRGNRLDTMRRSTGEEVYRAQGGYNDLDEVVNLLEQIDAEQRVFDEDD
ncbi:MAG: hypothetical protein FD174_2586 [Geobacteraceae bacterium]|nr:MAG: hypothetical protein FD174_2586 [Geobacteraceae bacterium]